jgi:hypothetical protein
VGHGTFTTVINCMDGRTQLPVNDFLKERYGVDYVDTITEPGPEGILVGSGTALASSIRTRVAISVEKHGSKAVALVAHHDCAGNPVSEEQRKEQAVRALDAIQSWGFGVEVLALWVGDDWSVEVLEVRQVG